MKYSFLTSASILIGAGVLTNATAFAGGYVTSVEEAPIVATPVEAPPSSDWAGAYGGGSLGYAFGGDDIVGLERRNTSGETLQHRSDLGAVDLKGPTFGLHLGYRWQRDNWVFGPELGVEGSSVDATDAIEAIGVVGEVKSELNYLVALRMKTGYAINPQTLLYGTLGVAHGDFDYTLSRPGNSQTESYSDTAFTAGLGLERKINERLSAFAEWEFRQFDKTEITYSDGDDHLVTNTSPEHHHIRVGVNFRF